MKVEIGQTIYWANEIDNYKVYGGSISSGIVTDKKNIRFQVTKPNGIIVTIRYESLFYAHNKKELIKNMLFSLQEDLKEIKEIIKNIKQANKTRKNVRKNMGEEQRIIMDIRRRATFYKKKDRQKICP